MATVSLPKPKSILAPDCLLFWNVGWDGYQNLLKQVGDRRVRVTYDRGDVEFMSPLPKHERKKSLLGQFVRILAREFHIPVLPMGSTTLSREDLDQGLEADESFYLGDLERLSDPDAINLEADPPRILRSKSRSPVAFSIAWEFMGPSECRNSGGSTDEL